MKITSTPRTFTVEMTEEELRYLCGLVGSQTGSDDEEHGVTTEFSDGLYYEMFAAVGSK